MIQVLFCLSILVLSGISSGSLLALSDQSQVVAATPASLIQPNVTIDLNPPVGKTVIPDKPIPATKENEENIFLNFENASLASVLNYLAEEKKINVLPDKGLADIKVTLSTRKPLTLERAWNILLTLLDMNKFTINQVGDLYRVVPKETNGKEPLPYYTSKTMDINDLPETADVIRYFYFLSNLKTDFVKTILPAILEGGEDRFIPLDDLQAFIVKEKSINIKAAMKIVKELDLGGIRESIKIITLQEANADDVKAKLEDIIGSADKDKTMRFTAMSKKKETTYFSSSTKITSYPLKNALVLLGNEKNINRVVDFIYKYLDVPIGSAKSRIHIKEIRYVEADKIASIIQNIIQAPQGQKSDKSVIVGKYKFFEDVTIHPEAATSEGRPSGNRLIISCNQDDWIRLEKLIDSIDKPQPQIAFELMIVNLTEQQTRVLGAQLQTKSNVGMGINQAVFSNIQKGPLVGKGTLPPVPGSTVNPLQDYMAVAAGAVSGEMGGGILTVGKTGNIWALIQAQFQIINSQIIGQPYLIANNNATDCELKIEEKRRLQGPLVSKDGSPQMATQETVPAGTTVVIVPKVNSDGIVDLKITMDLSQYVKVDSATEQGANTIITRKIETKTSMLAGEVLVFGGFSTSVQTITVNKTPILGDIPIIGNLFKNKEKTRTIQYLYVFIRPSIIKPMFEGGADKYTQLKLDYAKYKVIDHDIYGNESDPIQRWFFKPTHKTTKQKIDEARIGIFTPIDDFSSGKNRPKLVNIKSDPHFKASETITKQRKQLKERKGSEKISEKIEGDMVIEVPTELRNQSRLAAFAQAYEEVGTKPNG